MGTKETSVVEFAREFVQLVRAHNLKVGGSNPPPATKQSPADQALASGSPGFSFAGASRLAIDARNRHIFVAPPSETAAMLAPAQALTSPRRVRAVLLGDRINTANVDRMQVICPAPLTYRCGADGYVTLFRYGVAVLIGLATAQEDEVLRELRPRVSSPLATPEEETALVEIDAAKDDQILPGGPIVLKAPTPEHLIVVADALSKSVVLARDEREVATVLDQVE